MDQGGTTDHPEHTGEQFSSSQSSATTMCMAVLTDGGFTYADMIWTRVGREGDRCTMEVSTAGEMADCRQAGLVVLPISG